MIFDLASDLPDAASAADICIVGAGAAGIALAVECVRHGKRVTLLEAGGHASEPAAQDSSSGALGGRPYRGMQQGRARRLGGTTTLWGGQILELDPIDFGKRDWVPGSGWPFQKAELAPFYQRALVLEGVASSLTQDADVWKRLHLDPPALADFDLYFSRWCPEPNFASLHTATLQGPAVSVWLHATAVEAVCEGEHVRGIRARSACGRQAIFHADQYVFCLGAIESARFFLQPSTHAPWQQCAVLGRYFQDHIDCNAATLVATNPAALHQAFDTVFLNGFKYSPKLKLNADTQRRHRMLNVGATVFSSEEQDASLGELKALVKDGLRGHLRPPTPAQLRGALRHAPLLARKAYRYAVQHRAYHSPGAGLQLRVHCEQQPTSASTITLTPDRAALGLLRAQVNWVIAPTELESIRCFVHLARQALAPFADLVPHPALLQPADAFVDFCEDSFHHMGGMRMDASPRAGAVDLNLRLHGTSNCYVCSTAVYPGSGFSNPTHTLLALAARLAEHLA